MYLKIVMIGGVSHAEFRVVTIVDSISVCLGNNIQYLLITDNYV